MALHFIHQNLNCKQRHLACHYHFDHICLSFHHSIYFHTLGLLIIPGLLQSSSCPRAFSLALPLAWSAFLLFAPIHTFGKTLLDTPFHLIFVLYSTYHQPTYWNVYLFLSFIVCLPPLECKLPTDRSFFMFCLLLYCQVQEYCQARSVWAISILMNVQMNEWTGRQYIPAICLSSYKMDTV